MILTCNGFQVCLHLKILQGFVLGFCLFVCLFSKGENTQVWRNNKTRPRPQAAAVTSAAPTSEMLNLLSEHLACVQSLCVAYCLGFLNNHGVH